MKAHPAKQLAVAAPRALADFVNTGQKRGGETIWRLDASNFDAMPAAKHSKLVAQLPGLPLLGKHGLLNG